MLGFSQVLKPIKRQDLLEKAKKGHAFQTGAKVHFSEKSILGLGALYSYSYTGYSYTDQRKVKTDVEVTEDRARDLLLQKPHTNLLGHEYERNSYNFHVKASVMSKCYLPMLLASLPMCRDLKSGDFLHPLPNPLTPITINPPTLPPSPPKKPTHQHFVLVLSRCV